MNNIGVPGDKQNFAEKQNGSNGEFDGIFGGKQPESINTEKNLGEVTTSEMMREMFEDEMQQETKSEDKTGLEEIPDIMPVSEVKPLIADGTTERKLGKIGVSLVGEKVDTVGIGSEVKKIKELPLYEQSAARDEASAKMIYANFGRMIGNDDIGEIQAEEGKAA